MVRPHTGFSDVAAALAIPRSTLVSSDVTCQHARTQFVGGGGTYKRTCVCVCVSFVALQQRYMCWMCGVRREVGDDGTVAKERRRNSQREALVYPGEGIVFCDREEGKGRKGRKEEKEKYTTLTSVWQNTSPTSPDFGKRDAKMSSGFPTATNSP